jgi:hypothetical protein
MADIETKKRDDYGHAAGEWEWVGGTLKAPDGRVVLTSERVNVTDAQRILAALNRYDSDGDGH